MRTVLVSTHKRGVGLAILPTPRKSEELASYAQLLLRLGEQSASVHVLELTQAQALLYADSDCCFATCEGLTAENLAQLYAMVLGYTQVNDSQIDTVAVNVGPGSFTGLRLGCAFANGLNLGRKRNLWALSGESSAAHTPSVSDALNVSFWGRPSSDAEDPYATPMCFGDLYLQLRLWQDGSAQLVDVLEPHYGREPTPVLKLKQQKGSSLS